MCGRRARGQGRRSTDCVLGARVAPDALLAPNRTIPGMPLRSVECGMIIPFHRWGSSPRESDLLKVMGGEGGFKSGPQLS